MLYPTELRDLIGALIVWNDPKRKGPRLRRGPVSLRSWKTAYAASSVEASSSAFSPAAWARLAFLAKNSESSFTD